MDELTGVSSWSPLERQCVVERASLRSCAFAGTKDRCDRSSRCARRFTGDSCGRSVDREAVTADLMGSWNGEVTFRVTVCIVLKIYVGSVKNRAR